MFNAISILKEAKNLPNISSPIAKTSMCNSEKNPDKSQSKQIV